MTYKMKVNLSPMQMIENIPKQVMMKVDMSPVQMDSVKNILNIHMYSILKNILKQTMIMNIHM